MFTDKEEMFVFMSRLDFLEMENKKLRNKVLHMSNQTAFLERSLQNMKSLHFAEVPGTVKSTSSLYKDYDLKLFLSLLFSHSSTVLSN